MRVEAFAGALALFLGGTASAWAQAPLKVGEVRAFRAESPHPYPPGRGHRPVVWTDTVYSPGATFLRIRFRGFALAPGDYVTVSSSDGSDFWTYTGQGPKGNGNFWSFTVEGDTANVEIHAGPRNDHGYHIDAIGHGSVGLGPPAPTLEVVCGTEGREDVACHISDPNAPGFDTTQRPVARLLFVSGGFLFACTGWLVHGTNPDTLMTNNHCISKQKEVDTVDADFNFQRTTCGGATNEAISHYAGGTLLKTNDIDRHGRKGKGGLDYTLLTLLGNPEATWGELTPSSVDAAVDDLIWFIQHPGGDEKMVGLWEDSAMTARCHVHAVDQTYGRSAPGSQFAYECDSSPGSSGSPITDPNGLVIALHHFGGVSNAPCLNAGTAMADICADAGALLSCASPGPPPPPPSECMLGINKDPCSNDEDCCSGNCRRARCRGN